MMEGLLKHIGITLVETLASFCIVIVSSILIAILLWWNPKLSKIVSHLFQAARFECSRKDK